MPWIHFVYLLTLIIFPIGQTLLAQESQFPRFTIKQGQLDADGLPTSGAVLCAISAAGKCFTMPSSKASGSDDVIYEFGLEPRSERLPLTSGGSWVFLSSMFSGGGSGTLRRLTVLRHTQAGQIENLLPYETLSNVSDFAIWTRPDVSAYPILVDADFIWDMDHGETHFSAHRFVVEAFRFNPRTHQYVKVLSYKTTKKYDGGDGGTVRVLKPEREEIIRRLQAVSSK